MTRLPLSLLFLGLFACESGTPAEKRPDVSSPDTASEAAATCAKGWLLPPVEGADGPSCKPLADDYAPAANDTWPPCISDDGQYHPFDQNISSIARVAAFETIAGLLFTGEPPSPKAFEDARVAYSQDQGLESRVSRREDEHYPKADKACADMTAAELASNADRCVGPAQIQPLLTQAFSDGQLGKDPLLNAARIEAGLLWFLYLSSYKEATTCATTKKDCDSSYAYYTGGGGPDGRKGLSRLVRSLSKVVDERVFDGILAFRCWRDLDGADTASDKAMQAKALAQLDRALLRGMALIVLSRIQALRDASCDQTKAQAYFESIQILGRVLVREAKARDPAQGSALQAALAGDASANNLSQIEGILKSVFPCP